MRRTAITATLFSLALVGGAAAQQAVPTNPVTGAATGAAAGAAQGAAVAGPLGAVVGAPLGAAAGAVAGTVGAVGTVAGAVVGAPPPGGPLVVNVSPPPGPRGTVVTYGGVTYDRVPARALFTTGPRYTERSGIRIGRGSRVPEGIDVAPMRNVSIRRLRPGAPYGYFVSPDQKVVVIDPASRRVTRVIGRAG